MFQGLGDFVGGVTGGNKATTGFGQWYSEIQDSKGVSLETNIRG